MMTGDNDRILRRWERPCGRDFRQQIAFESGSTFPWLHDPEGEPQLQAWAVRGGAGPVELPRSGWTNAFAPGDDGAVQDGLAGV